MTVSASLFESNRGMDDGRPGYFVTNIRGTAARGQRQKRKSYPDINNAAKRAKQDANETSATTSFNYNYGCSGGSDQPKSCPASIGQIDYSPVAAASNFSNTVNWQHQSQHHIPISEHNFNYVGAISTSATFTTSTTASQPDSGFSSQFANLASWPYASLVSGDYASACTNLTTWGDPDLELTNSNILQQVQQCLDYEPAPIERNFSANSPLKAIDAIYPEYDAIPDCSPVTLTDLSDYQRVQSSDHSSLPGVSSQVRTSGDHTALNVSQLWNLQSHVDSAAVADSSTGIPAPAYLEAATGQMAASSRSAEIAVFPPVPATDVARNVALSRTADQRHRKASGSTADAADPATARPSFSSARASTINQPDGDGDLPIHIAVAAENEKAVASIIELMIAEKISLDTRNNLLQSALHVAVMTGHPGIISNLVQHGSSSLLVDRNGNNAVHLAVQTAPLETVRVLLQSTSSREALSRCNYQGFTPLHLAVFRRDVEMVSLLVRHGADCNCQDGTSGRTPLFHAISTAQEDIVRRLISHGANVNLPNYAGIMPLVVATDRRLKNISSLLISSGATINYRDDLG